MFPYYSRRIYYPKLRNPDAQNIVASENMVSNANQVITEKQLKMLFLKKNDKG